MIGRLLKVVNQGLVAYGCDLILMTYVTGRKMSTSCGDQSNVKRRMGMYAFEHGLLCLQTLLWKSPAFHPVKTKPDQSKVLLLMLGLHLNPSYLKLARKSLLLVPSAEGLGPGMLHAQLTMILPPNSTKNFFFSLYIRSSCVGWALVFFPPASLSRSCQATCVTRGCGKKKVSKPIGTRAPNLFLESLLVFFFFFENKKATGRNRQYWGEEGLFLIWPGLPSVLPRQRQNHSTMGKEGGSD